MANTITMDKDTIDFITGQNKELKDEFRSSIADMATAISGRVDDKIEMKMNVFDKKMDKMLAHNEKQNGWIQKHNDCINELSEDVDKVEDETGFWRWISRNPFKSASVFVVVFLGLAYGYHRIDLKKTIESRTGIHIIDDSHDTVTREGIND